MTTADTPVEEEVDFWRKCPELTVNDAVRLILKFVPGSYWKESRMPADVVPVYRRLTQDIQNFKICVYIRGMRITNEEDLVRLNEAFYENVVSYEEYLYSSWWDKGKILPIDLKRWLIENEIPLEFFNIDHVPSKDVEQEDSHKLIDKISSQNADSSGVLLEGNAIDVALQSFVESTAPEIPLHSSADRQRVHSPVTIPSALWQGKPPKSIRDAMRPREGQDGFSDAVIAYVLFNWCGLTNKTQLGRLLGKPGQDDSSYRRLTARLLDEAASFTITRD